MPSCACPNISFTTRAAIGSRPLTGFRLVDGDYEPIEPDANGNLPSAELGITFGLVDGQLEMWETATGKRLTSGLEEAAELQEQKEELLEQKEELQEQKEDLAQKLAEETKARQALEEELRRLRADKEKK